MQKITLSSSSISTFQGCRKKYEYEYIRQIHPVDTPKALSYGKVVHAGLERLFRMIRVDSVLNLSPTEIEVESYKSTVNNYVTIAIKDCGLSIEDELKARATLNAYIDTYLVSDFNNLMIVDVEHEFKMPIMHPKTKRKCNSIQIKGFADCIVRNNSDGRLYILEHKTSGQVTKGYIDRICIDWQIAMYAHFIGREFKEPVVGAIYDIIKKPAIRMGAGNSKKPAESIEEFEQRLKEYMTSEMFQREVIKFNDATMDVFLNDLWSISKEIQLCDNFYKCTGNCLKYGTCPHMPLCRANGDLESVKELFYVGRRSTETYNDEEE